MFFFFFQAEDGIRDGHVTGVQTCALPISSLVASSYRLDERTSDGSPENQSVRPSADRRPRADLPHCTWPRLSPFRRQRLALRALRRTGGTADAPLVQLRD